MSQSSATVTAALSSGPNYQSIFADALEAYHKKTGKDLRSHPLLDKLEICDSPDAVLTVLKEQIPGFDQSWNRDRDHKITKWLDPTVNVLYAFCDTIGAGLSLYPPAGMIFSGIGVLLSTVMAVRDSGDALFKLFERIESFFRRLETYIAIPSIAAGMTETIVKIVVEVLSILAIATKGIGQNRAKRFLKKLAGVRDIEDALQRLDELTQEEVWMATAQSLKTTHDVNANLVRIGGEVQGAREQVMGGVEKMRLQIAKEFGDLNRNQLRQDLRNWLSPPDPSVNFNIASDARHEGTAEWFTQCSTFNDWKASGSLIWIHGKPGSGKSILTSAIIQDIQAISNAGSAHMTYFFFDFKDTRKQDAQSLLSSILVQLSNQSESFCDVLLALYSAHHRGSEQPSDRALIQCLEDMLGVPEQVPIYIIIDALDECPNTTGMPSPRDKVLALVEKLVNLNIQNLRLCTTSRPEVDIRTSLERLTSFLISLHDQSGQKKDIIDFVSSVVYSDKNMRRWRDDDKVLVIETLSDRADGMFRWVYCQLEILRHCLPPSLRHILTELPETLDETYERILQEIPKANREYAHRLLQCLTVAVRPLYVEELAEVLAVDFSGPGES
ncbi:hypothetical protein BJV74DRAFT_295552 [Russula compacta]|nr:hypothetical protein BJV74DRAFT_295552 [Russula compacta]